MSTVGQMYVPPKSTAEQSECATTHGHQPRTNVTFHEPLDDRGATVYLASNNCSRCGLLFYAAGRATDADDEAKVRNEVSALLTSLK